jgi:pimeloyl-ACP methyl ester carboxylesterase
VSAPTGLLDPEADAGLAGFPHQPSKWLLLTEPARGLLQLNTVPFALPWLMRAPKGDGHGVLVLPGLLATDGSTRPLRAFLARLGYDVRGWQLGRNIGPTEALVQAMRSAVRDLVEDTGTPISLVGWSLGGIYARELAREQPGLVRRVITLGSPFRLAGPAPGRIGRTGRERVNPWGAPAGGGGSSVLPVPSSAVFSRRDGIVAWPTCTEQPSEGHENIEVRCAHLGFGVDPATLWAVADRLAQPAGTHVPFRAPSALRWLYPSGL